MASGINRVVLMGFVGPEVKMTDTSIEFSICVSGWTKTTGKYSYWHKVVVGGEYNIKLCKDNNIGKGSSVFVEGELRRGKLGEDRYDSVYVGVDGFNDIIRVLSGASHAQPVAVTAHPASVLPTKYKQPEPAFEPQDVPF